MAPVSLSHNNSSNYGTQDSKDSSDNQSYYGKYNKRNHMHHFLKRKKFLMTLRSFCTFFFLLKMNRFILSPSHSPFLLTEKRFHEKHFILS